MLLFIISIRDIYIDSSVIQIHLMLLFIRVLGASGLPYHIFKYISCYCLSTSLNKEAMREHIQIHLMLLFISHFCGFFRVIILHSSALYSLFTLFYQPLPYYCTSLSISSYFLLFSLLVKTLQLIFTW